MTIGGWQRPGLTTPASAKNVLTRLKLAKTRSRELSPGAEPDSRGKLRLKLHRPLILNKSKIFVRGGQSLNQN